MTAFLSVRNCSRWASLPVMVLTLTGCAYRGTMREGFYHPQQGDAKLPLKVNLVCGRQFESGEYTAESVYFSHSVHIKTHPALGQALTETCQSLFQQVIVTPSAQDDVGADITLLPAIELREQV